MSKKEYSATKDQINLVAKRLNDVMNEMVDLDGIPADTVILSSLHASAAFPWGIIEYRRKQ